MIPVNTPDCNWDFHLPGRPGEGVMPCMRVLDPPATRSFWALDEDDRALENPTTVCFQTWGFTEIDRVLIGFGDGAGAQTLNFYDGTLFHPGRQWPMPLSQPSLDYLKDGGFFIVEVPMVPPMPVAVWLAE